MRYYESILFIRCDNCRHSVEISESNNWKTIESKYEIKDYCPECYQELKDVL